MTTTTTTIKAAPASFATDVTLKAVLTSPTWTATNSSFNIGSVVGTTTWIDKVTVSLVGQPDSSKNPAKEVSTWLTDNASAISSASLTGELKVSSWAVVVDVTTKKNTTFNQAIHKNNLDECVDSITKVAAGTSLTGYPAKGAAGDTWAVILTTGVSTNKQPHAIRYGNYVSSITSETANQASTLQSQSWTYSNAPANYADVSKNTGTVSFTAVQTCPTDKWASAEACRGLLGIWGVNTPTESTTTAGGSHRFFQWLADASTEKNKVLSIEDKEVLNLVVAEIYANVYSAGGTKKCAAAPAGTTQYGVHTGTYTKGSGATSTILGASALVAGLIASLF